MSVEAQEGRQGCINFHQLFHQSFWQIVLADCSLYFSFSILKLKPCNTTYKDTWSDRLPGLHSKNFLHTKKLVVGLFWPSFDSMSNIVVSDSLAKLRAAVTLLRDGWDGLGTAIGFVVSFSFDLLPRFPTWHLQGQPQKWNHNDHKRMNPLCHFSSRASLSS